MEMHDPKRDRKIRHEYQILTLPEVA